MPPIIRATSWRHLCRRERDGRSRLVCQNRPSLGRENIPQDQQLAQVDTVGSIDVEDIDSGTSAGRQADKPGALPRKVTVPALPARIKQHNDAAGDAVAAAQIAGFAKVAFEARPG